MTLIELTNMGILTITGIVSYCFRTVGWWIIKILASLVNGIEEAVNKIYTMNNFFSSQEVNDFIARYKPVMWAILVLAICFLGYRIILNKKQDRQNIVFNLLFSLSVVILLPMLMLKFNDLTNYVIKDVKTEQSTSADQLIQSSLFDLYALDQNDFDFTNKNNIAPENVMNIDINEAFDVSSDTKYRDIFKNKLETLPNGEVNTVKLEKNWIAMDEDYYRYNIDFVTVIISLLATGVTLLCVGFKVARLIFELAFHKLFAMLFAFADIEEDNKKLKAILKNIISTFLVIMVTAILLKLYIMFNSWLTSTMADIGEVGIGFTPLTLARLIVLIGASFAVIDGPNIVERILGIDAGLKSGMNTMMGAYGAMKFMKEGFNMASNGAKLAAAGMDSLAKGGATMAGGVMGLVEDNNGNSKNTLSEEQENANNLNNNDTNQSTLSEEMEQANGKENNTPDLDKNDNSNNKTLNQDMEENNRAKANGSLEENNSKTLQEEMNEAENKNNLPNNLSEDIGNNNSRPESLQEQMDSINNGADNINSLQDDMNKLDNSDTGTLQSEMDNLNLGSDLNKDTGKSLHDEMKNNPLIDMNTPGANMNSKVSNGLNKENNTVSDTPTINTNNSNEPIGQAPKHDNVFTRKIGELKGSYNLGKNATSRFNIPDNYRNIKDKMNDKKGDK